MRIPLIYGSLCCMALASAFAYAQESLTGKYSIEHEIRSDVYDAAAMASVKPSKEMVDVFFTAAKAEPEVYRDIRKGVPKDIRVDRLSRYLSAKKSSGVAWTPLGGNPIPAFSWSYLKDDWGYTDVMVNSATSVRLASVSSPNLYWTVPAAGSRISPGETLVLPATSLTLKFYVGDKATFWSGNTTGLKTIQVDAATTTEGCEIYVNSTPPQATVYFNGKRWYMPTNTSSVRDPGNWEVLIHLDGFKDWHQTQDLAPGQRWDISAQLAK